MISNKVISKQNIFLAMAFVMFFMSYTINIFKVADQDSFTNFDRPDEGMIISRLDRSQYEGIFSYGALTGGMHYYSLDTEVEKEGFAKNNLLQYDSYLEGKPIPGEFVAYKSQTGGQAFLYACIQKILPVSNLVKIQIFRAINALFVTICFILFLGWVYRNFSFTSSIITFLLLLLSPALTLFGHNLWWALWSYYIPFITMLLVFERKSLNPEKWTNNKLLLAMFLSVFAKCIFTGFEYITSTLVAAICPVIYYCIDTEKTLKETILSLIKFSVIAVLAVIAEMFVLILQIRALDGTFMDGFNHIILSFGKRAVFKPDEIQYSVGEILSVYLNSGGVINTYSSLNITYLFFIILTVVACLLIFFFTRNLSKKTTNRNIALLSTTLISILAPLSWFIIFKEHAVVHMFLDYIVWYIPFLLYAFASIGQAIHLLFTMKKTKLLAVNKTI